MRFTLMLAACFVLLAGCATPQHVDDQQTVSVGQAPTPKPSVTPPAPVARTTGDVTRSAVTTEAPRAENAPVASATASPMAAPSVVPSATPMPSPSVSTSAKPVSLPPDAAPHIVDMSIDKTVVKSGDTVSGTIITSSNVASVEARIANYSVNVPKVAPGKFALSYAVPWIPFFLKRTYDMVVIARNAAGDEATRTVPITIR